jgi:hypothetical protein
LRNRVYEYAIGGNEITPMRPNKTNLNTKLFARPSNSNEEPTAKAWKNLFSLARTCRQLRKETSVLRFQLNTFVNDSCEIFSSFLWQLRPAYKDNIVEVSVRFKHEQMFAMRYTTTQKADYMDRCSSLTTIISTASVCNGWKAILAKYSEKRGLTLIDELEDSDSEPDSDSDESMKRCPCQECESVTHESLWWN